MTEGNDTPGTPATTKKPDCRVRQFKVGYIHDRDKRVPWIRIQGQWLSQAGFAINTPVQIHVMEGCLIFKVGD